MRLPGSIGMRLAVWFTLASVLVLGTLGLYLYQSLERELAWRDDIALAGRVERMRALLDDSASIDALRSRPQLYANMLGNRDSVLWLVYADGPPLIEVNPAKLPLPSLPVSPTVALADATQGPATRLAWIDVLQDGQRLRLVAGKMLTEREQMLASYRFKLAGALAIGALFSFVIGWVISRCGLFPVRQLAERAAAINVQQLHVRLTERLADLPHSHELHALTRALDQMLERLAEGFSQLSRFSEDLAHEMRTPLTNLMGHTQQTLRKERSVEEYQDLLASNQEEYEHLARMIDSMLFLARSEQSAAAIVCKEIDLSAMAAHLVEYFEGVAEERGVVFTVQASATLYADRLLVQRAMANLLANALRYGAADSTVTISAHAGEKVVELAVHNTGAAIDGRHLPRIFERFYRCDPARSKPDDTGGLGLAIVRSIMQLHGGTATVASDADGTCFTLHFPVRRPS